MKKSFLLLIAGAIATGATAQNAQHGVVFRQTNAVDQAKPSSQMQVRNAPVTPLASPSSSTERTSTACTSCGRWYDYDDSVLGLNGSLINGYYYTNINIWWDTTAIFGYSDGTYSTSTHVYGSEFSSVGLNLHPWAAAWNLNPPFNTSEIAVTPKDVYTIDSLKIGGFYSRNLAKPTVVDTLIVQMVYGTGNASGNLPIYLDYPNASEVGDYPGIGTGNLNFMSLLFDTVHNRAGAASGAPLTAAPWFPTPNPLTTYTYKFLLTVSDTITTGTTGGNGTLNKVYPRPGHVPADPPISMPAPAGNFSAASVTYRSGDPALTHVFTHDTVDYAGTTPVYKYNAFSPLVAYVQNSTTTHTATFPPYMNTPEGADWTSGYFNMQGARGGGPDVQYTPNWGWTAGTHTASALQYPDIWFHVYCPTCVTVGTPSLEANNVVATNTVNVYPNPAGDELNVSYSLVNSAVASITLTNMVGQVVASQNLANAISGKTVLNTAALPEGVYVYTLEADGNRLTGRVTIAH